MELPGGTLSVGVEEAGPEPPCGDARMKTMLRVNSLPAQYGMTDFKKLHVWEKAHALALHAPRMATGIRLARYSSIRSQIIRAAISIPANIVEGTQQESDRDFARFLRYAINSGCELEYHFILARDIGVVPEAEAFSLLSEVIEVRKMLHGLLVAVRKKKPPRPESDNTP